VQDFSQLQNGLNDQEASSISCNSSFRINSAIEVDVRDALPKRDHPLSGCKKRKGWWKGTQFLDLKDAGNPVENAKVYDEQGADEIAFLDITASYEERDILIDIVRRTAEEIFHPPHGRRGGQAFGGYSETA